MLMSSFTHRNRILSGSLSHAAILGLNALLAECPEILAEHFSVELPTVICQGIANNDVSITPSQQPTMIDKG